MGKKLLDIMRDKIRVKHYSLKTENVYIYWAKKYILFHNKRHPNTMGKKQIEEYLTYIDKEELKIQVEKVKELHKKDEIRSPLVF